MKKLLTLILSTLLILPSAAKALQTQSTVNPLIPVNGQPVTAPPVQQNFLHTWNDINTILSWFPINLNNQSFVTGNLNIVNFNGGLNANSSTCWRGNGVWASCAGSASGSQGDIQYNFNGAFSSDSGFTRDPSTFTTNISGGGLTLGSPTGGDLGEGFLNVAGGLAVNGVTISTSFPTITLSGDTTGTGTTSITTTTGKVHGVTYPATPSTNTVPVVTSSNTVTYEAVPNAALANSSITIAGHSVSLGGTQTIACGDLSNGGTACTAATGTSGATVPFLNGVNTWSGSSNTFGAVSLGTTTLSNVTGSTQCLHVNSSGIVSGTGADCGSGSSGISIGTTTITGGTTTRVLFDNAGVVGEYSISGTGNVAMTTNGIFTTPNLGTPSAITLTNGTGLPISGLVNIGSNTMLSNWTSSSAAVLANTIPSCANDGSHALVYVNGTGLQCETITAGSGTVNAGTANQLAYYATSTNAVSGQAFLTTTSLGGLIWTGTSAPGATTNIGLTTAPIGTQINVLTPLFSDVTLGVGIGTTLTVPSDSVYIGNQVAHKMTSDGFYEFSGSVFGNGVHNVAIGAYAMGAATPASCTAKSGATSYTVAIGAYSGSNETCTHDDIDNTFVGDHSAFFATTGSGNTIIGGDTMGLSTGNQNTVVGYNATGFNGNLSGSNNLILGAFVASTTLTSGSSNILIGVDSSTDVASGSTSNTLKIKGTGTPAIVGTGLNSSPVIGIGTTAPNANVLFVNGSANATVQTPAISTSTFTPSGQGGNDIIVNLVHASCPCTLANFSGTIVPGQHGVLYVVQSSTGSDTIGTWGSDYFIAGGTSAITLSTSANAIDVFSYSVKDATHIVLSGPSLNVTH